MQTNLPERYNGKAAPKCDAPKVGEACTADAVADTPTSLGPWAALCERHYARWGVSPALGTRYGDAPE